MSEYGSAQDLVAAVTAGDAVVVVVGDTYDVDAEDGDARGVVLRGTPLPVAP